MPPQRGSDRDAEDGLKEIIDLYTQRTSDKDAAKEISQHSSLSTLAEEDRSSFPSTTTSHFDKPQAGGTFLDTINADTSRGSHGQKDSNAAFNTSPAKAWKTGDGLGRSNSDPRENGVMRPSAPTPRRSAKYPSRPPFWLNTTDNDLPGRSVNAHPSHSAPDLVDPYLTALPPLPIDDLWQLPELRVHSRPEKLLQKGSLTRWASLDNVLRYQEEKAERRQRCSMQVSSRNSIADAIAGAGPDNGGCESVPVSPSAASAHSHDSFPPPSVHEHNTFRHIAAEIGFCFTIAMTQFLTEYLISGFAIELSKGPSSGATESTSTGKFWPASLLSLILSAMLLIFARLSDMFGGYMCFMFGVVWLAIWTMIPGFWINSMLILDISRAMQGLAIAAFMPSTFAMVGSIYPEGPRKNFVLGLYSGCAPLGFFGGLLIAAALPVDQSGWYFWIAAGLSGITFVTAFLTVPSDRTARRTPDRKMDWIGAVLITMGLILVSYGLAVEPYVRHSQQPGFPSWVVIGSLTLGLVLLAVALWYEGWCAKCPLLPFDFFAPKSVKAFCMACLCFYATYGAWLYNSVRFFQDPTGVAGGGSSSISGTELAIWFLPTAIGGVVLCVVGGLLLHLVPIMVLLLLSALAWIAAPLLLALAPLPLEYWKFVMPSMICATLGIDLTFTISIVFISSVQPLEYQGLAGAVCSILVNLAMSFALSISEIVSKKAASVMQGSSGVSPTTWGYRGAFTYAAASAAVGFIICALLVRISRSAVDSKAEGGRRGSTSSMSTMAEMRLGSWGVQNEAARSRLQGEAARSRLQGEAARSNV